MRNVEAARIHKLGQNCITEHEVAELLPKLRELELRWKEDSIDRERAFLIHDMLGSPGPIGETREEFFKRMEDLQTDVACEPWRFIHSAWEKAVALAQSGRMREALSILDGFPSKLGDELRRTLLPLTAKAASDLDRQQGIPEEQVTLGVSMLDAALLFDPDLKLAKSQVDRWQKQRTPKPKPIGFAPEHSQMKLFAPTALFKFIKQIETNLPLSETAFLNALKAKARKPK